MRSFIEIQQSILDAKAEASELNGLEVLTTSEQTLNSANSSSKVSIWRLWVWIMAYAIWVHEQIVSKNAENSRPHNVPWYREQVFAFLDGLNLVWLDGRFQYNTVGVDDVEERKIIKRAAILESNDGELVIKIATDNGGTIEPISPEQLVRFTAYMQQIKDAGNILRIINEPADDLKIGLVVYVDPLIIDLATGALLNSSEESFPVNEAIDNYLSNLEFNGGFVREYFRDTIQRASGIKLPLINELEWKYSGFDFAPIVNWKIPNSGYFRVLPENLTITYEAYDLANG